MGAENITPNGIQSPDRPAHSESLYRLCYCSQHLGIDKRKILKDILKKCCTHKIQLAGRRIQWWAIVNTIIDLSKEGNFLSI